MADALYAQLQSIPGAADQFTAFGNAFASGTPAVGEATFSPLLAESGAWVNRIRDGVDFGVQACDAALSLFDNVEKIKDLAAVLGGSGAEPGTDTIVEVTAQLNAVRAGIEEVKADLVAIRTELDAAGEFMEALQDALDSLDVAALRTEALAALTPELLSKGAGLNRITDLMTQQEFRQRFSAAIRDQFFASPSSAAIQQQLRLFLADLKFTLSQQMDGLFAAAYTIITEQVTGAIASAPVVGELKSYIKAEVAGHARIEGDSLKELRVDGDLGFPARRRPEVQRLRCHP